MLEKKINLIVVYNNYLLLSHLWIFTHLSIIRKKLIAFLIVSNFVHEKIWDDVHEKSQYGKYGFAILNYVAAGGSFRYLNNDSIMKIKLCGLHKSLFDIYD